MSSSWTLSVDGLVLGSRHGVGFQYFMFIQAGDLKNKCQKSRSPKCFLLPLPGCAGPGPAVRLQLQMDSAGEDLL